MNAGPFVKAYRNGYFMRLNVVPISARAAAFIAYSISKSIVSLLPSPCRATALSAARRLDTIDLEMELRHAFERRHSKMLTSFFTTEPVC
jgi:hypothetical protein